MYLVIPRCLGASVVAELVTERLRAEIFVLSKPSPSARPAGQLGPLEARQLPGFFAYARYTGSARCFCARMCCLSEFTTPLVVWLVVESVCPHDSDFGFVVTCLRLFMRWESVWIRS